MAENSLIADIRAYRNRSAFKQPYVPLASAICVLCDEDIPQTSEQDLIDHDAMPITVKATGAAAEALIGLYPTMNEYSSANDHAEGNGSGSGCKTAKLSPG
eukprot:509193_1